MREEDTQFISRLSSGALEKMRGLGLRNIGEASAWFAAAEHDKGKEGSRWASFFSGGKEDGEFGAAAVNTDFSPLQRERLQAAVTALEQNKIALAGQTTLT